MHIEFLDFEKEFDPSRVITNAEIMDSNGVFTPDGIYSEKIFGSINGEEVEYSCYCGKCKGRVLEGMTCRDCNTLVEPKRANIGRLGWIDLGPENKVINPRFLPFIAMYIGQSRLNSYINEDMAIDTDGNVIINSASSESKKSKDLLPDCVGMGVPDFIENFDAILETYHAAKTGHADSKEEIYEFIRQNRSILFTSKIPVFSPRLRPIVVIGDKVITDHINEKYVSIIKLVAGMRALRRDKTSLSYVPYMNKIQSLLSEVDEAVINSLNGKKGLIRNTVLGSRLNYSARCVLTPLPPGHEIDEMHIPYITALELFKLEIMNFLHRKYNMTYFKAMVRILKASAEFDEEIYDFMIDRIGENGKECLLNRNPTIAIGSILCMRITHIKRTMNDKTLSIKPNILKFLNADHDGDVLNIFLTLIQDTEEAFKKLKPQNLVFSSNDGKLNEFISFNKDYLLGLQTLISNN